MTTPVRAILDYGTNSLKLVVCRVEGDTLSTQLDTERITRLGENIVRDGLLTSGDVERILAATAELIDEARVFTPATIDAYGTAALRACTNRHLLSEPLRNRFGLEMRLLSGSEEACAGFLGVRSEWAGDEPLATLDLGGGSTELTLGNGMLPEQAISLPFGARGLLRDVPISDPPSYEEIEAVRKIVRSHLRDVPLLPVGTHLVLIGGAATTLAGYARHLWSAPGEKIAETLTPEALDLLTMKLGRMTQEERRALPGTDRSDVIVHGVVALRELLGALGVDTAWVSLRSLPHGLLLAERDGRMLDSDAPVTPLPSLDFPPLDRPKRKGEVLFLLRTPESRFWLQTKYRYGGDTYRIPGGGVDHNEKSVDAVMREVWEETGLREPRPLPLARLTFIGPDGRPVDWYTDLYLVSMPDNLEPHPIDTSEGISGWLAVTPDQLQPHIDHLESLDEKRHAWGLFRAAAMKYLRDRCAQGRL